MKVDSNFKMIKLPAKVWMLLFHASFVISDYGTVSEIINNSCLSCHERATIYPANEVRRNASCVYDGYIANNGQRVLSTT